MAAILRMIEACLMTAVGAFFCVLSQSSIYWQFLNPKYAWLTMTSGILLIILGFGCLLHRERCPKPTEIGALAVVLLLALVAVVLPNPLFGQSDDAPVEGSLTMTWPEQGPARMQIDGTEYIRINPAELIMGETEGWVRPGERYVIQGMVVRNPELDEAGYIAVGRLFIACCFADASGVATLVEVDDPTRHEPGQWLQVAGTLSPLTGQRGGSLAMTGTLSAITSDRLGLTDATLSPTAQPGVPFIFEVRKEEPFAF